MADPGHLDRLHRDLVDRGLLMAAGWVALRLNYIPRDASRQQLDDMRHAFFAGAQHVFATVYHMLDDDREPTVDDLRRMTVIAGELDDWVKEFELLTKKPGGSA